MPIHQGDQFIAGFGVSGGTTEQDVAIAETAFQELEASH
ncbi:MAG: heme-binding protein [Verrucomicrobia bacterium]|nr:heme-binding protein [Verrucomicrobiota bacterium]